MYKCTERVLKGDAKADFVPQANLVGSGTVTNFTMVMATKTVHVFLPTIIVIKDYACKDI